MTRLTVILCLILSTACSFKAKTQTMQLVQIAIPQTHSSAKAKMVSTSGDVHTASDGPNPSSFSDFNCFAVNVTGPGVPVNGNLHCSKPQDGIGIIAGFVPSTASSVTLSVPTGPGRHITLIGVDSNVGCPDLNRMLDDAGHSRDPFNGISSPYFLGETFVDILGDSTVAIKAAFDPLDPRTVFQSCGLGDQGPSIAPTAGYQGYFVESASGPLQTLGLDPAPSVAVGATEISGVTAIPGLASLGLRNDSHSGPPINAGISYSAYGSGGSYRRAVYQLQWDLTDLDTDIFPYAKMQLEFRGGQADTCLSSSLFGASVGVYDRTSANWLTLGHGNAFGPPHWSWGGSTINVPVGEISVTKADDTENIVVNIEANYASNTSACPSAVYVAHASMQFYKTLEAMANDGSNSMFISVNGIYANGGSGTTILLKPNQTAGFFASGGVPPFVFQKINGTIDPLTGFYTAPPSGTDTVTLTDSSTPQQTQTATVIVEPAGSILGLTTGAGISSPPRNADGTYTAGSCIPLTNSTLGFDGATPNATGPGITGINQGIMSGGYYALSNCTSSLGSPPNINSGSSSGSTYYYQITQAGLTYLSPSAAVAGGNLNELQGGGLLFNVVPQAFSVNGRAVLSGPSLVSAGYCETFSLVTADGFNNQILPDVTQAVQISNLPSGFYSTSSCSAPSATTTATILAGTSSIPIYFQTPSTGIISFSSTVSATSPPTPGFAVGAGALSVLAITTPVRFNVAVNAGNTVPDGSNCMAFDLTTINSFGTPQNVTASVSPTVFTQGGGTYTSQANCISNSGMGNPTVTSGTSLTTFWAKIYISGSTVQVSSTTSPQILDASSSLIVNY